MYYYNPYYNLFRLYDIVKGHYSSNVKYFGMYVNKLKRQKRGGYKRKRGIRIDMKPVRVHPKISTYIILWGDDENMQHVLTKGDNCEGSVIYFDKRQIWTVYPYKRVTSSDTRYCGACERKGLYIRLMPKDFCRIFGTNPFDAQPESEK